MLDGHRVLPMAQAAALGDVFLTTTGNRDVLTAEHFAVMKDGAVLANAGHFDVEVDVVGLAGAAVEVHRRVRPQVDAYELPDGRRLLLVAEGRLVNLAAGEGHPPSVMDISFAVQALTVEWLATAELAPGVHEVPPAIDDEVARTKLAVLGVDLDPLTAGADALPVQLAGVTGGWAHDEPGRLHLRVDAAGVTTRLHAEAGGWVLRGGCVGDAVLWRRGRRGEGEAVALGFTGAHPAYDVAVALRLRLAVGESRRVRLVEVTEPVLATRLVDRQWSRPAAGRWVVDDLATGSGASVDPDTVVAGMRAMGWPG